MRSLIALCSIKATSYDVSFNFMRLVILFGSFLATLLLHAAPKFVAEIPISTSRYTINSSALCATAKETLAYLNKGRAYDPSVIHEGKVIQFSLERIKASLIFICQHQNAINDPNFVKKHFRFVRWYPDRKQIRPDLKDKILMTKYYIHRAEARSKPSADFLYQLYALPEEEALLTVEEASAKPQLIRFQHGKQAILKGILEKEKVPVLAYLKRADLEAALMQGTIELHFNYPPRKIIFNVHRNNNIPYDKNKNPYQQERYWYFKEVDGIKGYGKDAEYKITVNPEVTFAADLKQFGLGKMLMIQYSDKAGNTLTQMGIFADTGGAFQNNLYQIDYLAGSYGSLSEFYKATAALPNAVRAYFMVLKK